MAPQKRLRISDKFCHWNPKNSETQSKFRNSDTTVASGEDKKGGEKVLLWIQQCCDSPTNPYQNWALWGPWVLGGTTQWIIWDQLCLETNVMNLLKLLLAPPPPLAGYNAVHKKARHIFWKITVFFWDKVSQDLRNVSKEQKWCIGSNFI